MTGHFGVDPTQDDGGYAECGSSAHVGLFGNNTSTDATAGGGAGGAGVFGLTLSVNAAGVFGANNGTGGVGVQGNGPDVGVSGFSQKNAAHAIAPRISAGPRSSLGSVIAKNSCIASSEAMKMTAHVGSCRP